MRKFITVAAIACCLSLSLLVNPAHAQRRGGGGYGGRGYGGGYYGGRGYGGGYYGGGYYGGGFGLGINVGGYGYPYNDGYYAPFGNYSYEPAVYAAPTYTYASDAGVTVDVAGVHVGTTRQSYFAPDEPSTIAKIHVLVPDPNARVSFDDTVTQQMGTDRIFISPPLDPAKTYIYSVKATWMDNGKEVTRTQDVKVQAGHATKLDLRGQGDVHLLGVPPREIRQEKREDKREEKRDEKPD
jgi:uncharacterized protein (TIGR03000 family)